MASLVVVLPVVGTAGWYRHQARAKAAVSAPSAYGNVGLVLELLEIDAVPADAAG